MAKVEKKKSIYIATPMYGGMCNGLFARGLTDLVITLLQNGHEVHFQDIYNSSLITEARNFLTEDFLRKGYDYMLFIDADQGFNPMGVLKMIEENEDVISGVVPLKIINWDGVLNASRQGKVDLYNYTSAHNIIPLNNNPIDISKKIEVASAGTGLMLISRSVFEKMMPTTTKYKFGSTPCLNLNQGDIINNFWHIYTTEDQHQLGEDVNFCRKWRELGGKVYTTFWPQATHIGHYIYT
jgi:hypothetical protein